MPGISLLSLRLRDLTGPAAAAAGTAAGLVAVLAWLAGRATPRNVEPSRERPFRARRAGWQGTALTALLAIAGCCAVALQRLPGFDRVDSVWPAGVLDYLPAVPAVGLVLLAAAIVRLRPLRGFAPRRENVPGLLARSQLERHPEQHTAIALVLVLSVGIQVFAVVCFAIQLTSGPSWLPAARAGAEAGLLAGAVGALVLTLAAFASHFRWATHRRRGEYGGLFAHGLPPPRVSESLAAEQRAVTWSSLLAGGLLGTALAWFTPSAAGARPASFWGAAAAACACLAGLLVWTIGVGALARRLPAGSGPGPGPRRP